LARDQSPSRLATRGVLMTHTPGSGSPVTRTPFKHSLARAGQDTPGAFARATRGRLADRDA
jgi:hypothetical protein